MGSRDACQLRASALVTVLVGVLLFAEPVQSSVLVKWREAFRRFLEEKEELISAALPGSRAANVSSSEQLVDALLDMNVGTIRIVRDVTLNVSTAKEQIQRVVGDNQTALDLGRNVLILGNASFPLLDFNSISNMISVGGNMVMELRNLRLRGLFKDLDDSPAAFARDSTGTLRLTTIILQRTACLPPAQQIDKLLQEAARSSPSDGPSAASSLVAGPSGQRAATDAVGTDSGSAADLGPISASSMDQPVFAVDEPYCVKAFTSVDPLGTDCYESPLLLQDYSFNTANADRKDASEAELYPPSVGGSAGGGVGMTVRFNFTVVVCEVFIVPPCAEQRGDNLSACIAAEVARKRASRSPPSPPPSSSPPPSPPPSSPPPALPPTASPYASSPPPAGLQSRPRGSGGVDLRVVLIPVLGGSALLAALLLGFVVWWRRRRRGAGGAGSGGGAAGKLESQDSDQVLQIKTLDDGGPPPGKGSKGGKGDTGAGPPGRDTRGSVACTLGSAATLGTLGSATLGSTPSPGCSPADSAGTDPTRAIRLHHQLGSGSFGRVYYGTWQGQAAAIKIIPHSEAANARVQQEVALAVRFAHPHVVRCLHGVTFESTDASIAQTESLRSSPSVAGAAPAGNNMETWIVMEYCDAGSLASRLAMRTAALRPTAAAAAGAPRPSGALLWAQDSGGGGGPPGGGRQGSGSAGAAACLMHMRGVLSVARDIAAGMAYLHALNVCHGDLKCENVLLSHNPGCAAAAPRRGGSGCAADGAPPGGGEAAGRQAPAAAAEGPSSASAGGAGAGALPVVPFVAKVADFGLSKTFTEACSHMSTATVGTVTHMCPVLLLTGQMRPSCDVFSFGIMLWELATGGTPFAGMRYAEVVYKVAVAGLRPAFPPSTPRRLAALAEACWAADPAARPTFEQLEAQLGEMLAAADELQAEAEAAATAGEVRGAAAAAVAAAPVSSEDAAVAHHWAAAAAAALLE